MEREIVLAFEQLRMILTDSATALMAAAATKFIDTHCIYLRPVLPYEIMANWSAERNGGGSEMNLVEDRPMEKISKSWAKLEYRGKSEVGFGVSNAATLLSQVIWRPQVYFDSPNEHTGSAVVPRLKLLMKSRMIRDTTKGNSRERVGRE